VTEGAAVTTAVTSAEPATHFTCDYAALRIKQSAQASIRMPSV